MNKTIEKKLNEGRQYREFSLENFEVRSLEDGEMTVRGYATTFGAPYVLYREPGYTLLEQIEPDAFIDCDMSDVIMQYDHEGRVFARTSNKTLEVSVEAGGLLTLAYLGGTQLGKQLFEEISGGYTTKMSWGFRVGERRREITENRETGEVTVLQRITKVEKIYDVSAVSLPANNFTSIAARSFGEGVIAEVKKELLARERERQREKIKILLDL